MVRIEVVIRDIYDYYDVDGKMSPASAREYLEYMKLSVEETGEPKGPQSHTIKALRIIARGSESQLLGKVSQKLREENNGV